MRAKHQLLWSAVNAVALLAVLASSGCGPKRPPAVVTGAAGAAAGARGTGLQNDSDRSAETPFLGSEIQPIDNEMANRDELGNPATGDEASPLADIYFEFDQASLTDAARAALARHAAWLASHVDVRVVVEGHCDERGTVEYNLALGDKRAQAARDQLISLGVAADRLRAASLGKERPIATGHDEAAGARNRRAHFAVSR
jgi:peptidoglycan-associated lipoprotein